VQQWEAVADGMAEAAVLMRAETLRPEGKRSCAWAQRQQTKVERGLRWMNERLGDKYCVGERFSLADMALGRCVSYLEFRFPDGRRRERYAAVGRSSLAMEERPSFQATLMQA
jgi:glutathione S-transferase